MNNKIYLRKKNFATADVYIWNGTIDLNTKCYPPFLPSYLKQPQYMGYLFCYNEADPLFQKVIYLLRPYLNLRFSDPAGIISVR